MNVLVLHSELGVLRGGGENFTRNLFTAFAARGHRVAAAFTADRSAKYPFPLPACMEPVPIPGWWSRKPGQQALAAIARRLPTAWSLRRRCDHLREAASWRTIRWHNRRFSRRVQQVMGGRWQQFDVVYVHGDPELAHAVARCRPTVLRLPGPVSAELAPALRAVQAVFANGDALTRIRAFLGDGALELPVGIDESIFKPGSTSVRARLGWTAEDVVFGYVGRLTHIKGVDLLAAAFREISRTAMCAKLLIIGTGEEETSIRAMLQREIARGTAHIEAGVDHCHLPSWYRAMDVLVMPSRYENFSNAIIEAMACGVPVLASAVGGNRFVAAAGTGWLFESESLPSLEGRLRHLACSGRVAALRGVAAADYARARHSWRTTAERLEAILREHAAGALAS